MGGPDRPSVGFPKEKHGFVPCMYENSENYRGIWTTRMALWGGHVPQVHVLQMKSMVLCHPGTRILRFVRKMDHPRGGRSLSDLGYPLRLYSNLYHSGEASNGLAAFGGVLYGNNNINEMFDKFNVW